MATAAGEITGGQGTDEHRSVGVDKDNTSNPPGLPDQAPNPTTKLVVSPPATAKTQAILAETVPWFRLHQGGLYQNDKIIYGILLMKNEYGGQGHFHDRMLITRLAHQTNSDRSLTKVVTEAALNNLKNRSMIAVVIGHDFEKLPVKFRDDEQFGVTGFWHLSKIFAVRAEKLNGKKAEQHTWLMGCLTYAGPRETMWWTSVDDKTKEAAVSVMDSDKTFDDYFDQQRCSTCGESPITIFQEGWVCTNQICAKLCMDASGSLLKEPTYPYSRT